MRDPASTLGAAVIASFLLTIACTTSAPSGCTPLPAPTVPVVTDATAEVQCVANKILAGETSLQALGQCAVSAIEDPTVIADIVSWLLGHPAFVAKIPADQAATLRASVHRVRLTGRYDAPSDAGADR